MFQNSELKSHLEKSSVIKTKSTVIAEWNLNTSENILLIGNYRYRPADEINSKYRTLPNSFDPIDEGNFYTGATDADIVIDGGYDDQNIPITFISKKEKEKLLYSLEDCFGRFRPRSGINKVRYFANKFSHHTNLNMAKRPRYYMASKDDKFKYWSSYRIEDGIERGIANKAINNRNYIDDASPFVVYKKEIPTNRIIVKMQTNVGTVNLGPFSNSSGSFNDPLYGIENQTTPVIWKIQYLKDGSWIDAIKFTENSTRSDGSPIVGPDGYVEIAYGEISNGVYGWNLVENDSNILNYAIDQFLTATIEDKNKDLSTSQLQFKLISGIRVVVDSMNVYDSTLDIIEISPRLYANITDMVMDFSINKIASDLGVTGLPVGQLLASTGSLNLFDYNQIFNPNNSFSILSNYNHKNMQIKFYESILDVNGYDYHVPIKTLYADGFPEFKNTDRSVDIQLRDLFFYFESLTAPQIFLQNVSISQAISLLLDSVGFSNYVFYRTESEKDFIIPFFFISPDQTIAQVLQDLAISSQYAMFFDEYNNFIIMSKGYMLPSDGERSVDIELLGNQDQVKDGVIKNKTTSDKLANIIEITSKDNDVYNSGTINYSSRYIQRSYGSIKQAAMIDRDKTWIYKPALLWEISGTENTKSVNDQVSNQSTYVLSAIPLNSDLSKSVPTVENNQIINNTMDFGEAVYWITRYNGYFHSNGEMIKYDAVQYSIPGLAGGNVWITSSQEYQNYFSNLPFNGKIYPTGLVRIYCEPNYEEIDGIVILKNGPVAKHGRGQFGTEIVDHHAGLNPYWLSNDTIKGCSMKSSYLFGSTTPPEISVGKAGINNTLAKKTTRSSVIRNFLSNSFTSEDITNKLTKASVETGTVQSSALVMNGPAFTTIESPIDFISYVYKPLTNKFKHFGTRMRIIGKIENNLNRGQTPIGSTSYYVVTGTSPDQSISVNGGSGGLGVLLNPETNNGYYLELIALTENNLDKYESATNLHNIIFYKIGASGEDAVPVKLWGGLSNITVDDGKFTGQSRLSGEQNPTVYDLAVEYQDIGNIRRFFLYVNNKIIATVDDSNPLPAYNNMALFIRGASRVMFENIYAMTNNYSQNTTFAIDTPISSIISDSEIDANESFRKYALSSVIQSTYLSGISPAETPKYNIYFEEFGSIMREAAYMKIRYDKAYPALYAKISPTFNNIKGYTVSGFQAGAYGAEFLLFNATDTALSLDESTGNYLRIQGITFTQESNHELSVDEFFNKNGDFSNVQYNNFNEIQSPIRIRKDYEDIKNSRITYGKKEFSIDGKYIQSQDDANEMMDWITKKIMKPRKSIGVRVFGLPIVQLGDLVTVSYISDSVSAIPNNSKFIVYGIEYGRSSKGPEIELFLSEVI